MLNRNPIYGTPQGNTLTGGAGSDIIYGFDPAGPQGAITATRVAAALTQPLFATAPSADSSRLFIVEKTGLIKILDLASGEVLPTPFLDVSTEIAADGEQGLLGLAFHPNYAANGRFYVYLSTPNRDVEIRAYAVSADPDMAAPASLQRVLTIDFPGTTRNHRAGWVGFGPDGYLYASVGDGGVADNAQNRANLLGKILRLDVNADAFPRDAGRNYAIPDDNPFAEIPGARGEIFAFGLRNPWRTSFDRLAGDFYIGDVGEGRFEEVDLGERGANYGWRTTEGPFDPAAFPGLTPPIHAYDHSRGNSVTGGYVYRGPSEALQGLYVFGDFGNGHIRTLQFKNGAWIIVDRTAQIVPDAGAIDMPSSFGQDNLGRLYVVDFDGEVFRLTPQAVLADAADRLSGGGGSDILFGGGGNDRLDGGPGRDRMIGGTGNDAYFIDNPFDRAVESNAADVDRVVSKVSHTLAANVENLVLSGASGITGVGNGLDNVITGNAAANRIDGAGANDWLLGAAGNDSLLGGIGNDRLYGQSGDDIGRGGSGNDIIDGGTGKDILSGGPGADVFLFRRTNDTSVVGANADLIIDFSRPAGDTLHLAVIDANEAVAGNQAFTFIGPAAFTGPAQIRAVHGGGETRILLNTDRDSAFEALVRISGSETVSSDWFVL
jgi:Ca2+-binding RTX toxin-like protein